MKGLPVFIVLLILIGGVLGGVQRFNSPEDALQAPTPQRPTVTPRPRPTSPLLATSIPASTATPVAQAPAAQVAPTAVTPEATREVQGRPNSVPTPAPQTSVQLLRVGNTDGIGVFLRRTPSLNDKLRPFVDGSPMEVVGPAVSAEGLTWQHVRAPDGAEGYIPSQYLIGGSIAAGTSPGSPPATGPRTRD